MNLLVRINLALLVTFTLAVLAIGYGTSSVLQASARRGALREAGLMLDSALASRAYTAEEITPLLAEAMQTRFLPQTIPFYAATQNFLRVRDQHPDYFYKEATLNPTNPRDRATDWEADIIQRFRSESSSHEIVGTRDTPLGESLYLARPIRAQPECMSCHSLASTAPATLVARYGSSNGFGWQVNETVGAQIVSIPLSRALDEAQSVQRALMLRIGLALFFVLLLVNAVLYLLVVRPVRRIVTLAEAVSLGTPAEGHFPTRGSRELLALARAFERMRISLERALSLVEH